MEKIKFWKDNKVDQEFELTPDQLETKFREWLWTKELAWLSFCSSSRTIHYFITTDENGLLSSYNADEYREIEAGLFMVDLEFVQALNKLKKLLPERVKSAPEKLSIWGLAIREHIDGNKDLVKLIRSITEQYRDNPLVMEEMIGLEAGDWVKKLTEYLPPK